MERAEHLIFALKLVNYGTVRRERETTSSFQSIEAMVNYFN